MANIRNLFLVLTKGLAFHDFEKMEVWRNLLIFRCFLFFLVVSVHFFERVQKLKLIKICF